MLFEKSHHEAREGDAGAVERVDEFRLAVRVAEAAVETPRLVVGEARARGHLEPLLLARRPEFEIVALRRRKAHVARAELEDTVVEPQPLQNRLGFADEDFKLLEGSLGMHEIHHLHLVELVDAEHPARHLAGGTGLAAEAGRVGRELDGQVLCREDVVAVVVRDGNLGRGDEPEVVDLAVV